MVSWRLEHRAQPTTEAPRSRWPKTSQSSGSITSGFECEISTALAFYRVLGFAVVRRAEGDDVAIIRNEHGVELNLVFNAPRKRICAATFSSVPSSSNSPSSKP